MGFLPALAILRPVEPADPRPPNPNVRSRVASGIGLRTTLGLGGVGARSLRDWQSQQALMWPIQEENPQNTTGFCPQGRYKKRQKTRVFFCFSLRRWD